MNGSHAPELTNLLREISEDIAKNIIKEGKPIMLIDEYSWYREVLSLMSKQVNLCDSCVLLLENGMEQEAYLLARSQFNNTLWIKYLCEAEEGDNSRLKEFYYQPYINQLKLNKNLRKLIQDFGDALDDNCKSEEIISGLDSSSEAIQRTLDRENVGTKTKSIAELAKQDSLLFSMYVTLYNEGSKFEHSDISTTKLYRKQATGECSSDQAFIFNLGDSNEECWFKVFNYSLMSLYWAFDSISNRIQNRESQLFEPTPYGRGAYSKKDFTDIILKFKYCTKMCEDIEKNKK